MDLLAERTRNISPYTYALNNPIYFIDKDGLAALPPIGLEVEDGKLHEDIDGSWIYDEESNTWLGLSGSADILNGIPLSEVTVNNNFEEKFYLDGYFNGTPSGDYAPPTFELDLFSPLRWISRNQSGYGYFNGESKGGFTGDSTGEDGEFYGFIEYPWSPGNSPRYYNIKTFKGSLEMFSKEVENASTAMSLFSNSDSENKDFNEWYYIYMKDGSQKGVGTQKERDSIINSPEGTSVWYFYK